VIDIDLLLSRMDLRRLSTIILEQSDRGFREGYGVGATEVGFDMKARQDPHLLEALEQHIIELSQETTSHLVGDLKQSLLDGLREKESLHQLIQRVDGVFEGLEDWKSERIVRTEVARATNLGRNKAWSDSGNSPYKMWFSPAVHSDRTAEDSRRFHGQIQEINDPFVDVATGQITMTPPNRPHCRCGMRALKELPKNIVYIGGQMYDRDHVQPEAMFYKAVGFLDFMKIGWTDEAREAVAEARRRKAALDLNDDDFKELDEFKKSLYGKSEVDLINIVQSVLDGCRNLELNLMSWYQGEMSGLDGIVTDVFRMGVGNTRYMKRFGKEPLGVRDKDDTKGTIKFYLANQMFAKKFLADKDGLVTVYRGVNGGTYKRMDATNIKIGEKVDFDCYNLTYWSLSREVADEFVAADGGVVVETKIPYQRVFAHYELGDSSFKDEKEITVFGGKVPGTIVDVRDIDSWESRFVMLRECDSNCAEPAFAFDMVNDFYSKYTESQQQTILEGLKKAIDRQNNHGLTERNKFVKRVQQGDATDYDRAMVKAWGEATDVLVKASLNWDKMSTKQKLSAGVDALSSKYPNGLGWNWSLYGNILGWWDEAENRKDSGKTTCLDEVSHNYYVDPMSIQDKIENKVLGD